MNMRSLLTSLEVIERVCTYEKGKSESSKKPSHRSEKGKKSPGTEGPIRVPKKACFEKQCDLCKNYGGAYTTHNTRECRRFEKDGKQKSDFCSAKKGSKKPYPIKHNFAQLTKKIAKLKKALKKSLKKGKKRTYKDSDSNSEQEVGSGSTRKVVKFRETVEDTSFTPPSPIKATHMTLASNITGNSNTSFSNITDNSNMSVSDINGESNKSVSDFNGKGNTSFSKAGDVMMTSSKEIKGILKKKSTLLNKAHRRAKPLQQQL